MATGAYQHDESAFPHQLLTKEGLLSRDPDNPVGFWVVSVPPFRHIVDTLKWWVALECPERLE